MSNCSPGRTYGERPHVELASTAIPHLGCLIDELIECGEDIISELNFGNSRIPDISQPNPETGDSL